MILAFIDWTADPGAFTLPKLPAPLWGGDSLSMIEIFIIALIIAVSYFSYKKWGKEETKEKESKKTSKKSNKKYIVYCIYAVVIIALLTRYLLLLSEKEIRWYGLAFALGFMLGLWIVSKIWKHEKLNDAWLDKLFIYVFFGTVIGARLGHCLFYEPADYLANPINIFKIWEGGLASHGGTLGILVAIYIYSKKVTRKSMLWTLDRLAIPVGFVAALIRLGNLMNSEIFGFTTTMPWGFKFLSSPVWLYDDRINGAACHPTQIYEAMCYIITGLICMWLYWKKEAYKRQGLILGVFFIGIFLTRFFIEYLKFEQKDFEKTMILNMGQILSIPFILAGIWLIYKGLKTPKSPKGDLEREKPKQHKK